MLRNKPHILIVADKWCDRNPSSGISNSEQMIRLPLEESGLATYQIFSFDEYYYSNQRDTDSALLAICAETKPDMLFISWFAVPGSPFNPKYETLDIIKNRYGIPVIIIWWDSVKPQNIKTAESLLPVVSFHIVPDSSSAYLKYTNQPEKYIPFWVAHSTTIFNDAGFKRDIDVSFAGSVDPYYERQARLHALFSNNINVYVSGGQREHRLSIEDYAAILKRSKITLNFSRNPHGQFQIRGRVYEATLCGAMLLESENPETARWFEPMVDYVPFRDGKDLVAKVRYYLENDDEREKIAAAGHSKTTQRYTGTAFWKTMIDLVIPHESGPGRVDLLTMAEKALLNGDFNAAESAVKAFVERYPDNKEAHSILLDIVRVKIKGNAAALVSAGTNSLNIGNKTKLV